MAVRALLGIFVDFAVAARAWDRVIFIVTSVLVILLVVRIIPIRFAGPIVVISRAVSHDSSFQSSDSLPPITPNPRI